MRKTISSMIIILSLVLSICTNFLVQNSTVKAATSNAVDTRSRLGINLEGLSDWSGANMFVDMMKTSRTWGVVNSPWTALDTSQMDEYGWPTIDDCAVVVSTEYQLQAGTYKLSFECESNSVQVQPTACYFGVENLVYGENNTVTADIIVPEGQTIMMINFIDTVSGVRNVKLIRPGYPADGSVLFTDEFLKFIEPFSTLRYMDYLNTNAQNSGKSHTDKIKWADRKTSQHASQAATTGNAIGGCWEYLVALTNLTKKDAWINIPYNASDDYISNLAAFLKENVDDGINIYVELSNEVWNWSFPQTYINQALAELDDTANSYDLQYAKQSANIAKIFRDIYGQNAMNDNIRVVLAWQIGWAPADAMPRNMFEYIDRYYEAPSNLFYALAGAPYFSEPQPQDCTSIEVIHDFMRESSDNSVEGKKQYIQAALDWNLKGGAICYEGGPHHQGQVFDNLETRLAAHRDAEMKNLIIRDMQTNWFDIGGGLFCYYSATGKYSQYGCWALSEHVTELDTPKYQAIKHLYDENKTYTEINPSYQPATPAPSSEPGKVLLAYDGFNTDVGIALEDHSTGLGWRGSWTVQDNPGQGYKIDNSNPLTYSTLVSSENYATGGYSYKTAIHTLDTMTRAALPYIKNDNVYGKTGTSLWASFLMRMESNDTRMSIIDTTNWWETDGLSIGKTSASDEYISMQAGTKTAISNVPISKNTNFYVLKYDFTNDDSTTISCWINPSLKVLEPKSEPDMKIVTDSFLGIKAFEWYPGAHENNGSIDEIRLGSTYELVAPSTGFNQFGFDNSLANEARYQPATDEDGDGVYEIANAGQLYWFAHQVNTAEEKSINAKLTADIDMSTGIPDGLVWSPIASTDIEKPSIEGWIYDSAYYKGTFDGNGYTISNLNMNSYPVGFRRTVGLFGTVADGGVVKNLHIDNYTHTGISQDGRYGAIAGSILTGGTITDCWVNNSTLEASSSVGGIAVGSNYGGLVENTYVTNSTLTVARGGYVVGDSRADQGGLHGTVNNCYADSENVNSPQHGTIADCYGNITADQFNSGEIAYKLNAGREDTVWGQELTIDAYPIVGGIKVYQISDTEYTNEQPANPNVTPTSTEAPTPIATTTPSLEPTPVVTEVPTPTVEPTKEPTEKPTEEPAQEPTKEPIEEPTEEPVTFNQYGFDESATDEARYKPATDKDGDGVYEIKNAGQLYWFAHQVNTAEDKTINAKLTADIDMSAGIPEGLVWSPIASTDISGAGLNGSIYERAYYTGIFDGNGHTISNLDMSAFPRQRRRGVGLFSAVGENGVVKNLHMDNYKHVGIVVEGDLGDGRYGAIAGSVIDGGTVMDCWVSNSEINAPETVGGIAVGSNYSGYVKNVYVVNSSLTVARGGYVVGDSRSDQNNLYGTNENCYSDKAPVISSQSGTTIDCAGEITAEQFASGEIAYKLNAGREESIWGQELTVDAYPVISGMAVYQESDTEYTNDSPDQFNKYGFDESATDEARYKPATDKDGDGVYEIKNAGQLYWFAHQVNTAEDKTINAKLTADIDMSAGIPEGLIWSPIASTDISGAGLNGSIYERAYYTGVFNGNGHTISNLDMSAFPRQRRRGVGLFSAVGENGVVKNLHMDNYKHTGIVVEGDLGDGRYGAIAGSVIDGGTVMDCWVSNSEINAPETVGGIAVGSNYSGYVKNVYVVNSSLTVARGGYVVGDSRSDQNNLYGTNENCYSDKAPVISSQSGTTIDCVAEITAEQFASGEIAYKLNAGREESIWGQKLTVDAYPVISGMAVYQISDTEYSNVNAG